MLHVLAYSPAAPRPSERLARDAADRFLERYVEGDGRVVRRDQGGDTVSEGQAYALLLAVAVDDPGRFDQVWTWTREHLQRGDGLLAWRWRDGRVVDQSPASDADVDTAQALSLAAERFGVPAYREASIRIARSVLASETVKAPAGLVLVAGPWARSPSIVNPSYFSPAGFAALAATTGDRRWSALASSSHRLVSALTAHRPGLPPDWARLAGDVLQPIGAPDDPQGQPSYGFDAARLVVRLAADCSPGGRQLASQTRRLLPPAGEPVMAVYDLHGRPLVGYEHPVGTVAAAAAAQTDGDSDAARRLLDHAQALDERNPTYYGAAWVALGRLLLTTGLLDGCRPAPGGASS
jgi:endoglucanase